MGSRNTGFDNNTFASVAFGFGIEGDAEGEEGKAAERQGPSILGPAPFKFYQDDVAAFIDADDITVRRQAANYPVPHRYSA